MSIRCVTDEEAKILIQNGAGYFGKRALIGDSSLIVIEGKDGKFLSPRSYFRFTEFSVAPSKYLVSKIGGLLDD